MTRHFQGKHNSPVQGVEWKHEDGQMFIFDKAQGWVPSQLTIADLLHCVVDAVEVDADGNPLQPTAEDVAAERGDRAQQIAADES